MTKDLEEYYKNIKYINNLVAEYEDNEGNLFAVTPSNLLAAVQYTELNKQDYEQAVFNQLIPKDFETTEIEIEKPVSKYEVTHNEKDKFTLTTAKQKVKQVWYVMNGLGIRKAFNNKEAALKVAKEINKKIYEVCKI